MSNAYIEQDSFLYNNILYRNGDLIYLKPDKAYLVNSTTGTTTHAVNSVVRYIITQCYGSDGSYPLYINWHDYEGNTSINHPSYNGGGYIHPSQIESGGVQYTYTVSYDANGGSGAPSSQTKTYGVDLTLSSTKPTRTGYTFKGWGTSPDDTTVDYAAGATYIANASITLYAIWQINSYTLTINPNGGTWDGSTSSQTFTQSYNTTKIIANPTRSGYRFKGWSLSGSGVLSNTTYTYGAGAGTLIAQWVAIYYLDLNVHVNGTVTNNTTAVMADVYINGSKVASGVSDYYKQHDTGTTYEIKNIVVGDGYTKLSTDGLSGTITKNASADIKVGKNYTITYNANGGGSSDNQTQAVNYGTSWTTKGAIFTKTGYTLLSWNTKADGSGTKYSLSTAQSSTQKSNLTLYAQWIVNSYTHTLTHWLFGFKNGEGNNTGGTAYQIGSSKFTAEYGESIIFDESLATTIPNGCRLSGFGTSFVTGDWTSYNIGDSLVQNTSTANVQYTYRPISYSIIYELDGGINNTNNPSTYNILYGLSFWAPTKDGHIFDGWYINNTKITGINEGEDATFASIDDLYSKLSTRTTGNTVVTAKWTPKTYSIILNPDNGDTTETQVKTYGVDFVLPDAPINGLYRFIGWLDTNSNKIYQPGELFVSNINTTFVAQWVLDECVIVFNVGEGMCDTAYKTITIGQQIGELPTPTKEYYVFMRWEDSDGQKVTPETIFTEDNEIYAVFTKNTGMWVYKNGRWVKSIAHANNVTCHTLIWHNGAWHKAILDGESQVSIIIKKSLPFKLGLKE